MESYLITKIASIIEGDITLRKPVYINYIFTDSRTAFSGEEGLFFALKGLRHNGHLYIDELYEKGIRNFIISEPIKKIEKYKEANFIQVDNTIRALQKLAVFHRNRFNIPVIGITGSNGKTIVKDWLAQVLDKNKIITKSPKSYNSQIGVPLSIWQLNKSTQIGIFEAGISMPEEMNHLQKIIQPKIGIFTNIGNAHQENFKNIQEKIREKLNLFKNCNTLIYCKDHKQIQQEIYNNGLLSKTRFFTWASKQNANLMIKNITKARYSTKIEASFLKEIRTIEIPFTDDASIENAIHVWATLLALKCDNIDITQEMKNLAPIAMRLELKKGIDNCTLINDSYNSDIESLTIALDFLNQQNQHIDKTLILSDILQSGLSSKDLYSKVNELINQKNIPRLIGIGENIYKSNNIFTIKGEFYKNTDEFLNEIKNINFSDEAILLKGARKFEFERISEILQEKAHRTVLEINLDAITHNLNHFKSILNPETKIMVMVKAFSYGSGSFEIANLLEHNRVDYLGVAFVDEGISLRKAGITLPIMVMNPEEQAMSLMMDYNLEPEIYSFKNLHSFLKILPIKDKKQYPVHIKIDTGMNRLGFKPDEVDSLIKILVDNKLKIKSVFSHLAGANEETHDSFSLSQFKCFDSVKLKFEKAWKEPILFHILNSAGIQRFPKYQYNMVRLGIGLYGIGIDDKLKNISTLKTQISQIKEISPDDTIGYNRKGKTKKSGIIATLPIGYADGLNRMLSNGKGNVLINGEFAPIIGNICMDMTMIDITGIEAKEGDVVIIFGDAIPISELARTLNTIPYEIFTSISSRVKRIYYHDN